MLAASQKKTASALRLVLVIAIALGIAIACWWLNRRPALEQVHINDAAISVEVVRGSEALARGLSGRNELSPNSGMLLVYDSSGFPSIWMKDMRFAIDILWINDDGQIVSIARNVTPDTYPQTFQSDEPARYVLELPSGYAGSQGIAEGQSVSLPPL